MRISNDVLYDILVNCRDSLEELELEQVQMKQISDRMLEALLAPNLRTLDLSCNRLGFIQFQQMLDEILMNGKCQRLRSLSLQYNPIFRELEYQPAQKYVDFLQLNHEMLFSRASEAPFELDLGATWINMPQNSQQKFQISKILQVLQTHYNINVKLFGYVQSEITNVIYGITPEYLKCLFAHLLGAYNGGCNSTLRIVNATSQSEGYTNQLSPQATKTLGSLHLDLSQSNFRTSTPLLRQQLDIALFYGQQLASRIKYLNLSNSHLGQDFSSQLYDRLYEFLCNCVNLEVLILQEYEDKKLNDMVCDLLMDQRFGKKLTTLSLAEFMDGNQILNALKGLKRLPQLHALYLYLSQPRIKSLKAIAELFVPDGISESVLTGHCYCRTTRAQIAELDIFQDIEAEEVVLQKSPLRILVLQQALAPSAFSASMSMEDIRQEISEQNAARELKVESPLQSGSGVASSDATQTAGCGPMSCASCEVRRVQMRRMTANTQEHTGAISATTGCPAAQHIARAPSLAVLAGRFPGQMEMDLRVLELSGTSLGASDIDILEALLWTVPLCSHLGLEHCRLRDGQCAKLIRAFFGVRDQRKRTRHATKRRGLSLSHNGAGVEAWTAFLEVLTAFELDDDVDTECFNGFDVCNSSELLRTSGASEAQSASDNLKTLGSSDVSLTHLVSQISDAPIQSEDTKNKTNSPLPAWDVLDRDMRYLALDFGRSLSHSVQRKLLHGLIDLHPRVQFLVLTGFCEDEIAIAKYLKFSPLIELVAQNCRVGEQIKFDYFAIQDKTAGLPGPWAFDDGFCLRDALRYDLQ